MADLWPIWGIPATLAIYKLSCFRIAYILHAEEYIPKMVAHFCHLHSMAIKTAFYGVFMAYFGGIGCPRNILLIVLSD